MSAAVITGIAGFAGRHLARHLLDEGVEVHGVARPGSEGLDGLPEGCRLHTADIRDQDRIEEILADIGPDDIYHLAAAANIVRGEREGMDTFDVNVTGSLHVFDAVRRVTPDSRVLFVSSGSVYGASAEGGTRLHEELPLLPMSQYAVSKMCGELMAREFGDQYGLRVVVVRPFNHTGPGQEPVYVCSEFARAAAAIALGQRPPEIMVGDIDLVRDFCDVRDVVRAYRLALEAGKGGDVFNICSGEGRLISGILDDLLERTGRDVAIERSEERFRGSDFERMIGSFDRLHERTGWTAEIPFQTTLDDLYRYWETRLRP